MRPSRNMILMFINGHLAQALNNISLSSVYGCIAQNKLIISALIAQIKSWYRRKPPSCDPRTSGESGMHWSFIIIRFLFNWKFWPYYLNLGHKDNLGLTIYKRVQVDLRPSGVSHACGGSHAQGTANEAKGVTWGGRNHLGEPRKGSRGATPAYICPYESRTRRRSRRVHNSSCCLLLVWEWEWECVGVEGVRRQCATWIFDHSSFGRELDHCAVGHSCGIVVMLTSMLWDIMGFYWAVPVR